MVSLSAQEARTSAHAAFAEEIRHWKLHKSLKYNSDSPPLDPEVQGVLLYHYDQMIAALFEIDQQTTPEYTGKATRIRYTMEAVELYDALLASPELQAQIPAGLSAHDVAIGLTGTVVTRVSTFDEKVLMSGHFVPHSLFYEIRPQQNLAR